MIHITLDDIYSNVSKEVTINKGKQYCSEGRVKVKDFGEKTNIVKATVSGTYDYDIEVEFDKNGKFDFAACECPAYNDHNGNCKHIVATMFKLYETGKSKKAEKLKEEYISKNILEFFTYRKSEDQVLVNMEYDYEFNYGSNGFLRETYLNLKIGESKLYIVKNTKKFIESIINNEQLYFGKEFTFDPSIHCFSDEDKSIIDLLIEIYDIENSLDEMSFSLRNPSLFKGKKVYLSQATIKRFFELSKNTKLNIIINENKYNDVEIVEEDIDIKFILAEENSDFKLEINTENNIIPLVEDGRYIFSNNKVNKISHNQSQNLKPFIESIGIKNNNFIKIPEKHKEKFISYVYPAIKKIGSISLNKEVEETLYDPGLKINIFLDKINEGIASNVEFVYGDIIINPFKREYKDERNNNKIILRDIEKENETLSHFEDSEFKVGNEYIYLDDDDKIFDFIYNKLDLLSNICNIYYSDDFKTLKINKSYSISGGVRLKPENNLLEFKFSIEGITDEELKDVFKSIKEKKKYHKMKNGTFFSIESDELNKLQKLADYLEIEDMSNDKITLPKYKALYIDEYLKESNIKTIKRDLMFKELVQNIREPEDIEYNIPINIDSILRNYQKLGFKWLKTLKNYGFGGILADDMGLGKTIQVLSFLLSEKIENGTQPSLIITPTSLVYNWLSEIQKFTPDLKTVIISGNKEEREELINNINEYDVVITSYPLIRRDIDSYNDLEFRFCILDEAQHIKNPLSNNAKSVKEIKAQNYFALTGTPVENSLTELWSIFDFIMPGLLYSHSKFVKKFEKPIVKEQDKESLEELRRYINPFILRRLKKDVLHELPEKIESEIVSQLTDEQKKIYLAYLNKIKGEIKEEINANGIEKSHIKILAGLTRLRQICCHPSMFIENYEGESGKLLLLEELIKENIDGGHRILIFSQFTSMLGIIKDMLLENNIDYKYLDGSTNINDRGRLVKEFNEGEGAVFLISLKAGGTGLNLTGADTVIHFDPWWNPAVEEQASDRAYRIGQKNTVHVMKLITKDTIEEKIYELQQKKKKLIDSIIKPGETIISKLSEEEIKYIFDLE
jgi:SNF2 family DNA or RNA helicase